MPLDGRGERRGEPSLQRPLTQPAALRAVTEGPDGVVAGAGASAIALACGLGLSSEAAYQVFGAICASEDEAEARSTLAFSLVIGHHFMAADHGTRSHAHVLDLAARWLLA